MITANGIHKMAEVDDFDKGCIGPGRDDYIDVSFKATSAEEVISKACQFIGVSDMANSVERNACDEIGRIDIARTETDEGDELTASQLEQWKAGKFRAWYCIYTIYLYKSEPVSA